MNWRKAHSLTTLLSQFNTACPSRLKVSDGFIGDPAHRARFSYHNPDAHGIVRAGDFTHDPRYGMDIDRITDELAASRDSRILELIANGLYLNRSNWRWVKYNGPNPHRKHFHISVVPPAQGGDDSRPWKLPMFNGRPTQTPRRVPRTELSTRPEIREGSEGKLVKELQATLNAWYPKLTPLAEDGVFGTATRARVSYFQGRAGLAKNGVVGPRTWAALGFV